MSKKILVTGAGGYLGGHVTKDLLNKGAEVIAVDFKTENIDVRAKKIEIDIFSGNPDIFEELDSPDICLHLAWKDGFVHNSPAHIEYLSAHYIFIKNMINGGLKQLAVMGSMHEVGYFEGMIDEDTLCNPQSLYGIAKDSLRRSIFQMQKEKNILVQWLRGYYIYGDDKKNNSIFAKLIQAEEQGKEFFPFTSGKNQYDFIHIEDLARQIAAVVMQDEVTGIINCCSGQPVSLANQVEKFIAENHMKIKLQYGAFPDREYDSPALWGDASKIKRIMGQNRGK